ncbi:MSMEG_1061 family FMN-dependent PPOX-type flavoprotein [Roseovarius arcticus]|uniref:MSMEG_1061 family FMN-dependent PPOX-type flavoprotein n=1 Tax=Roseovarius arcticus TaxID=2547404 RepID=UPI001110B0E8|nr:MSMEG_1061 family FMN-dependent PPOX-type flavoprotein [Roseovarius arcticus]
MLLTIQQLDTGMLEVDEEIETAERLRELLPTEGFVNTFLKVSDRLNDVARSFIGLAPFVIVATKASGGLIDISPKGDPAGFVEVYDDKTLIIPDRLGNHRVDGFQNLLEDGNVALLFIVPGHGDTLRIAGKARVVRDAAISKRHSINGKEPLLALVIDVEEAFMHCSKSFIRSRLWHPDYWPKRKSAPTLAEWVIETVEREQTLEDVQDDHSTDEEARLY